MGAAMLSSHDQPCHALVTITTTTIIINNKNKFALSVNYSVG